MGKDISISKRLGRQCLGSIVLAICLFVAKAEAALIKLELVAVVASNTFVESFPYGWYNQVSTLALGEPIRIDMIFNTDPRYFTKPNFSAPIRNDIWPLQGFTFYQKPDHLLGGDEAVSSYLEKEGDVLYGYLLSGPNYFEFDFVLNTVTWEGSATMYGVPHEDFDENSSASLVASIVGKISSHLVPDESSTLLFLSSCLVVMIGLERWRMSKDLRNQV